MSNQLVEPPVRYLANASKLGILVGGTHSLEVPLAPKNVGSKNHASPVEFKTLRCVDAPNLVESSVLSGPKCRRRSGANPTVRFVVPGSSPIAENYVVDQTVWGGI